MDPEKRAKSAGLTLIVYCMIVDASTAAGVIGKAWLDFFCEPYCERGWREGAIETAGAQSKQRYARRRRAPTLWRSQAPSQLLSIERLLEHGLLLRRR